MIPDDPLGRDGPHIDSFLCKDNRLVSVFHVQGSQHTSSVALALYNKSSLFLSIFLRRATATPPLLRPPDSRPSSQQQPVCVQAVLSTPPTSASTPWPAPSVMAQPTKHAHWPHSGPPEWHPPRRSPSPSPAPPSQRSAEETSELKRKLYDIFPDQKQRIDRILNDNPYMRDLNALSGLLLG